MIDWLSLIIPVKHKKILGNKTIIVSPDGEVISQFTAGLSVEGSHDTNYYLSSHSNDDLYFSGNPSKFLQGHNVFGTLDCFYLVKSALIYLNNQLDLCIDLDKLDKAINNAIITRVDITFSFSLKSIEQVRSFIYLLENKSSSRHGRSAMVGNTLYFGQKSKRWSIKMYSKGDEVNTLLKSHQFSSKISSDNQLLLRDFAKNKLRIELTLRKKQLSREGITRLDNNKRIEYLNNFNKLKEIPAKLGDLTEKVILKLYNKYIKKMEWNTKIKLNNSDLRDLPRFCWNTYHAWRAGVDVRATMSRPTFARHRRLILSKGLDIKYAFTDDFQNNDNYILTIDKVLSAKSIQVPAWAYSRNLIVNSKDNYNTDDDVYFKLSSD